MNFEERLARAVDGLRRSVREAPVAPRRLLVLRRRRRAGLATTAAVAFVAVAVVAGQQLLDGGQETEVATRDQATEDTIPAEASPSGPVAARGEEHCQPPDPPEGGEANMTVFVYFFCDMSSFPRPEELYALPRSIPKTNAVLRAALEELLKGPTPEETLRGFDPVLPHGTKWLVDATITDDGVAIIDFAKELADVGNIGATSPAEAVRLTLEAAVRQFPTVKDAIYRLEGDPMAWCELFEWSCEGRSNY